MRQGAVPRCLFVWLSLFLGASPSCGLAHKHDETEAVPGTGGVERVASALQTAEAHRVPQQVAQERVTAHACAEAYAAEGARAQARCAKTWPNLAEQAVDEEDDDDEDAAAREVCRTQGVLEARLAGCKEAAAGFLLAQKRGFSPADFAAMSNFANVCSVTAMCID